jgi:hypothetical protein
MNQEGRSQKMNSYKQTFITAVAAAFTLLGALAQAQDKVNVPLDDPSRPATVKIGQVSGSITVKGYEGKEVVVEAHARNENEGRRRRDRDNDASAQGMKRSPSAARAWRSTKRAT